MPRIRIDLPEQFTFTTPIPIRITDLNYGGHVGNDAILSLLHEIRMQYLQSLGFTEMQFAGASLIMSDVGIEFKAEAFYGDILQAEVCVRELTKVAFEIVYKLSKKQEEQEVIVAIAKTGMVCYNYESKKVVAIPKDAIIKLKV